MERNKKFLENLLNAPSPSGFEKAALWEFSEEMKGLGIPLQYSDPAGNTVYGNNGGLLLSGHIDSISMSVIGITDGGFLRVVNNGGIDKKVMLGSRVSVLTYEGNIYTGVIGKTPVHLEWGTDGYDKATEIKDMFVDLGYDNKDDVKDLGIDVGCLVIFERGQALLDFGKEGGYVCAPDLDDKIGVYIVEEVARRVGKDSKVLFGALIGEEQGLRGAKIINDNEIQVKDSIDIDVTFDINKDLMEADDEPTILLGKGPVLVYGGDKNIDLIREIEDIAKEEHIPFQRSVSRPGGTNTDALQKRLTGCRTAHLAIPLRNMHTQQEIVSWADVDAAIELLVAYINWA